MEHRGLSRLREAGAAKVRFPEGTQEAVLINTGGGLAGGDEFSFDIAAGAGARLTVTTQAAERVYRTLGPPAVITTTLEAGPGAFLAWLPQETILFDGASLSRNLAAGIAADAALLAVEAVIFGRKEMGEVIRSVALRDRWRIRRGGRLVFADDIAIEGALPRSAATLGGAGAMATLLYVAADAEARLDRLRGAIAGGGASAWDGKLVARMLAADGFALRKALIPVLGALAGEAALPKVWSL
ncbi:MAG: urease accessory protein UreD [Hyphomicrobiales bacterium]